MKRTKKKMIIGYLRVSTIDQDVEKNKADILKFANQKGFAGKVTFVDEKVSGMKTWKKRKLAVIVENLQKGDILIVPELSRLGRSLPDIFQILQEISDRDVKVFSVKENFQLNGSDMQSKIMRTMLGLFAEIERDIISMRTREGLAHAKEKGKLLGRPPGPGKSKLDDHRDIIIQMLRAGIKRYVIAGQLHVTPATLGNFIKKHGIKVKPGYCDLPDIIEIDH